MDKKNIFNAIAKKSVKVLNVSLHAEANTTACAFAYQPKAPKALEKFKRK